MEEMANKTKEINVRVEPLNEFRKLRASVKKKFSEKEILNEIAKQRLAKARKTPDSEYLEL